MPPPGYAVSARRAIRIGERTAAFRRERARRPGGETRAFVGQRGEAGRWLVIYTARGRDRAEADVDGRSGAVLATWTGIQVPWLIARGTPGLFAHKLNAPYVWIPLALLFCAPFFDPRRPFRLLHLDLLALLAFGASNAFFTRGEISTSVPLVYPVLGYLLVRMLVAGFRGGTRDGPLVPFARPGWLAAGVILLAGFRIFLNVADSTVIDVGYAGTIGADRIEHGQQLYVQNDVHGDTYGPVNYLAYVPFELAFPWRGQLGNPPAAHAAAIAFDLLVLLGLLLLGRRLWPGRRGRLLGLALAWAWVSYPYTLFALQSNGNDTLVAALVVGALLALNSAPARGTLIALGSLTKFAPLALVPLFATGRGERSLRSLLPFAAMFAAALVVTVAPFVPDGGLRELYDTTLGYQAGRRDSPFSIWFQVPSLDWLQAMVSLAAVGLGLGVALVPRRREPHQVAALAAAVLIAVQLTARHWFYLYIVWFAPLVLAALFAERVERQPAYATVPSAPPRPALRA